MSGIRVMRRDVSREAAKVRDRAEQAKRDDERDHAEAGTSYRRGQHDTKHRPTREQRKAKRKAQRKARKAGRK